MWITAGTSFNTVGRHARETEAEPCHMLLGSVLKSRLNSLWPEMVGAACPIISDAFLVWKHGWIRSLSVGVPHSASLLCLNGRFALQENCLNSDVVEQIYKRNPILRYTQHPLHSPLLPLPYGDINLNCESREPSAPSDPVNLALSREAWLTESL